MNVMGSTSRCIACISMVMLAYASQSAQKASAQKEQTPTNSDQVALAPAETEETRFIGFLQSLDLQIDRADAVLWLTRPSSHLRDLLAERSKRIPPGLLKTPSNPARLSISVRELTQALQDVYSDSASKGAESESERANVIAQNFAIDRATASAWVRRMDQLRPFSNAAAYEFATTIGGMRWEHSTQRLTISVSSPIDRGRVRAMFAKDKDVDIVLAEANSSAVRAAAARVLARSRELIDFPANPLGDLQVIQDTIAGRIQVRADRSLKITPDLERELVAASEPVKLSLTIGDVPRLQDESCAAITNCGPPLRANLQLKINSTYCTSGFVLRHPVSGLYRVSTAGHCADQGSGPWRHSSVEFGDQQIGYIAEQTVTSDNMDVATIAIGDRQFWYPNGTVFRSKDKAAPVAGRVVQDSSRLNEQVCKGGTTTYLNTNAVESCGMIVEWMGSAASNVNNLGIMSPCVSDGGDSGSPYYSQTYPTVAYGIHKGKDSSGRCAFSWVSDVEAKWGYQVLISPRQPHGNITPLSPPVRPVDSRSNIGTVGPLSGGVSRSFSVSSWGIGTPEAVIANITVTGSTSEGYLTAWEWNTARPANGIPLTSTMNFIAGQTRATTTIVPVGPTGRIGLQSSVGTHFILDIFGVVARPDLASAATEFVTLPAPRRISLSCAANTNCVSTLNGVYGPTDATAWAVNITVDSATSGYLVASGNATATSLVNYDGGRPISNLGFLGPSASGTIFVRPTTQARILIDIVGYQAPSRISNPEHLAYYAVDPVRVLDGVYGPGTVNVAVAPNPVPAYVAALPLPTADAHLLSLAATGTNATTYFVAWKTNDAIPPTSNLNLSLGQSVNNNHAISRALYSGGTSYVSDYGAFGSSRRLADAIGYFD